ncbi:polymer-forming cytoskeletal protein [Oleispirillum naphthae]|uniref:bactofilin family protein n=1 Tax=Oleispirillum naphthae TaxID=2838853 RepID=UPI00308229C3
MADKKVIPPSIISRGLTITGDLVSDGEIQVDGCVQGDIRCASLVVGLSGEIMGEVRTASIRLHGQLTGQVHAESVFLASTARMIGDVYHQSLAIEPGAFLQGMCRRSDEEQAAVPPAIAAPVVRPAEEKADESVSSDEVSSLAMSGKPVRGLMGVAS